MYQPPELPDLAPDSRQWRIDWFGEVAYPGNVKRRGQPSIQVAISPVQDSEPHDTPADFPATELEKQRNVWLPVGALPRIRIGDIWQSGALAWRPAYSTEAFADLEITPQTSTFIKAGISIEDNFLLPFADHPWHRSHTQSYCVLVTTRDFRLVIPGAEMIRCYFGSSSRLMQRLFTGPLASAPLWLSKDFNPETGHLHLKFSERTGNNTASDIGRIALSPIALKAAESIYSHCVSAKVNNEKAYPYMGFPFIGKTTLSCTGIWLPFGDNPKATFLAFHLDSCSHPFPFRTLSHEGADKTIKRSTNTGSAQASSKRTVAAIAGKGKLGDTDAGSRKTPRQVAFSDDVRFPDLRRKDIWEDRVLTMGTADVLVQHANGEIEQASLGTPESASESARSVDVVPSDHGNGAIAPRFHTPHWVKEGIYTIKMEELRGDRFAAYDFLLVAGRTEPIIQLPIICDEDGALLTSLMFTEPDGHHRPRRLCFVRFEWGYGNRNKSMFAIIEGKHPSGTPTVIEVQMADVIYVVKKLTKPKEATQSVR
jgi:hypothetical protein